MKPTRNMTMEELLALPVSIGLRTAARALRIGQNEAYRQAAAGEFPCPVKKRGREYVVTRPDLFRELGLEPGMVQTPGPAPGNEATGQAGADPGTAA